MKLTFLGGAGTVTGSKYLLACAGKKVLIDCGLFQGLKVLRQRNWNPLAVEPSTLDAVILTHAHIDHSGYLPLLVKNGFRGKIFSTAATRALCQILLPDAGHLQEEDTAFANKHGFSKHHPALPLYTEADARASLQYFEPVPWAQSHQLTPDLSFEFRPVGHIPGAAFARLVVAGRTITFSGDLGRARNLIMNPPSPLAPTDYLVVESTYGDRKHSKENPLETFERFINHTVKRGGIVLIPSFAVGRAQEVLYLVSQLKHSRKIPDIPVYLNSPMAESATHIFEKFVGEHALSREECNRMSKGVHFVSSVEESKMLNERKDPAIIISASGMATGGRVLHHLKSLAPDPKNLILFVGFQAAGTRGEAMIRGVESIKIHGGQVLVKAEVANIESLSAHADADEIIKWVGGLKKPPLKTFVTHGEPLSSETLRKRIQDELRWPVVVPDHGETFNLS